MACDRRKFDGISTETTSPSLFRRALKFEISKNHPFRSVLGIPFRPHIPLLGVWCIEHYFTPASQSRS